MDDVERVARALQDAVVLPDALAKSLARAALAAMGPVWRPIETAPDDAAHVRGLWVYSAQTKKPIRWEAIAGFFDDETGEFTDHDGNTPWRADDYTHWTPLPAAPQDRADGQ